MKKMILVLAMMLIGLTSATATEFKSVKKGKDLKFTKRYRNAQPIKFVERGVEFLIFHDGSFDFNTNYGVDHWRHTNSRRSSVNAKFTSPVSRIQYTSPRRRGIRILHDRNGAVRQIGNVFINYDRRGKVKRIGSVYMNYNRGNGRLKQVGGLRVNYNSWGKIVHLSGQVNYFNADLYCDMDYDSYDDYFEDEDKYYYKKGSKKNKYKRRKNIK